MFPNLGTYYFPQAANQGSVVSTDIPLPENAPQNNRNTRGMDAGVKRIDYATINKYQTEFASSLLKSRTGNEFMDFIEPIDSALDNIFLIQHLKHFDPEWHQQSLNYVNGLSKKDKFMLRAYTRNGDKLINTLIRTPDEFDADPDCIKYVNESIRQNKNNVIAMQILSELGINSERYIDFDKIDKYGRFIPKLNAEAYNVLIPTCSNITINKIKEHLLTLAGEIKRIINGAPPLTKHIRLFRGIQYDYVNNENSSTNMLFDLQGFQSMSLSIASALSFSGEYNENNLQTHSMIYSFIVHPGTQCIAMSGISHFPEEEEILVNMDLQCSFIPEFSEKLFLNLPTYHYSQLCHLIQSYPTKSLYVKDLVIAPQLVNRGARANNMSNSSSNASMRELNTGSQSNRESITSSNLNAAFYQMGYGRGGRLNLNTLRSKRLLNNQAKTRKRSVNKMNQGPSKKEITNLMDKIKTIEAKENDYAKVRDPGFGFIIVNKKANNRKNRNSK
jgi:hypothetical protein